MEKKSFISFAITFLIVVAVTIVGLRTPVMIDIDYKLYDSALKFKPLAPVSNKFLNIEVDDSTLDTLNMYPLKRSTVADGILVLRELGAKHVLLDTQMVDPTPPGINLTKMNEIPNTIDQAKNNTLAMSKQLINAYATGNLGGGEDSEEESQEYLSDLEWEYDDIFDDLLYQTNEIALNYDDYISKIFTFTNNVYSTNDFEESYILDFDKEISPEFITYLEETQSIKNITFYDNPIKLRNAHNPTIEPIMRSTLGSGFVATVLDRDGATRVTDLLYNKGGFYYPQLSFRYYLDSVGNPDIEIYKNKMILRNVIREGIEPHDVTIPITKNGEMVINWAGLEYKKTFTRERFYLLYEYDEILKNINQVLTKVLNNPDTNDYASRLGYQDVLEFYSDAEQIKREGDPNKFDNYIELREAFIENAGLLLNGSEDYPSLDIIYSGLVEEYLSSQDLSEEEKQPYYDVSNSITQIFEDGRVTYDNLILKRDKLVPEIKDSIVTLGYTATSTFDFGSNPFEKDYFNMGIYSTIANNLYSEEFIKILPDWISILLALLSAFIASTIIKKREAKNAIIMGSGLFFLILAIFLLLFRFTGIYIKLLIPSLSFIIVFIQKVSSKLLSTSKDKTFIKNAFGQYLSEDVIKDIIDDPSKLKLGGEVKEITAFFTDVKGFSTISEKLSPDELVTLLNEYLTAMSDIALDHKGTIDKYEGDAIIGFFGAPAPLPDHATKAVIAAIRMKEMEALLNIQFKEKGMTPSPVNTRIGINSGPCVVGNMGTPKKMDYTMMGSDVNIAARLEGVNKQYGTWILASERTMEKADDIFLARRLDRVRVVGINNPIRLYNPIAIMSEASDKQKQMVETFENALNLFELREWKKAKSEFKAVLTIAPEDKPAVRYIQLCEKFLEKQPESNWDGVFNLTSK